MGCDCGKWLKSPDENGCYEEVAEMKKSQKSSRVGIGCSSGYLPWVVLLHMNGGCSNSNLDTSKLLFNKEALL